jgi:predicted amidohydrolase
MKLRVASLQYALKPIQSFEDFAAQVCAQVATAADYRARLVVFPEYFSAQLFALGDTTAPVREQVKALAARKDAIVALFKALAIQHKIHIVAGTIPVFEAAKNQIENHCHFFAPSGNFVVQGKLIMTRFEAEEWIIKPAPALKVIDTEFGKLAIAICYDVEFPELVRAAALQGARILVVPSCTDDRQGWLRVRYCAQARAIENQMYVIHSGTVGGLPDVPACALNYGQAGLLTPSDYGFARDGILADGIANQEMMVVGDFDLALLEESLKNGTVLPLRDSVLAPAIAQSLEHVTLR